MLRPSLKTADFFSLPAEHHFKGPQNILDKHHLFNASEPVGSKRGGGNMAIEAKTEPLNQFFLFKKLTLSM